MTTARDGKAYRTKLYNLDAILAVGYSLLKLLYAGMLKASEKWTHPVQNWNLTLSQLAIHFEGRLDQALDI